MTNIRTYLLTRAVTQYVVTGSRPFRLGSRKWFETYGMNLQNPGKEIIDIFQAPSGRLIVQADQSGADALIVAYIAKPGNYRDLFSVGIKPHTFLAMHIFAHKRPDWFEGLECSKEAYLAAKPLALAQLAGYWTLDKRIKKSKPEYPIGKRTAHGKSYRMGAKTYQMANLKQSGGTLVLPIKDCQMFLAYFDQLFPEVIELQDEIEFTVKRDRQLINLFGFPRRFERAMTDPYIREAISWIPASTVACITHEAFIKTQRHIEANKLNWSLISNKHDSLACEVDATESETRACATFLKAALAKRLIGRDGVEFTMGSEVQIGQNWAEKTELNPGGME